MKKLYLIFLLIVFCYITKAQTADSIIKLPSVYIDGYIYPAGTISKLVDIKKDTIKSNKFRIHKFQIQRKYLVKKECTYELIKFPGRVVSIDRWSFEAKNEHIFRKYINNNIHFSDSTVKNFSNEFDFVYILAFVKFKIDSDCHIKDIEIVNKVEYFTTHEILSVFQSVPKSVIQEANMLCGANYYIEITFNFKKKKPDMTCSHYSPCDPRIFWKTIWKKK